MTRPGVRLGVDVGRRRVGIAACDPEGSFAYPVETIHRESGSGVVARVAELAHELGAIELVVGLPVNLAGRTTASTDDARAVASLLTQTGLAVRLVDERLSTNTASSGLRAAGRAARAQRAVVDQAAAVVILQQALDIERGTGQPAGELVQAEG